MREQTKQLLEFTRQNRGYILTAFAILVFFLVLGIVSDTGQRFFSAVGITDAGSITVHTPYPDTRVFLDNSLEKRSTQADEIIEIPSLPAGTHSAIIARRGHHPWTKTIELDNDEALTLRPFLVPHSPQTRTVQPSSPRYRTLVSAIMRADIPRSDSPAISSDETMAVWIENDAIHARWIGSSEEKPRDFCPTPDTCLDTITVTPAQSPVKNLAFFNDRNDVVIFSAQSGVYALEVTTVGTQNFQPIYQGDNPRFIKTSPNTIAVFDSDTLIEISL